MTETIVPSWKNKRVGTHYTEIHTYFAHTVSGYASEKKFHISCLPLRKMDAENAKSASTRNGLIKLYEAGETKFIVV